MRQRTEEKQHQTRAIAASICFVMEEEEEKEEEEEDLRTVLRTGGVAAHERVASHAFTLVQTFRGRRVRCRQFTSLYSSSGSVMETAIPASFLSS
jgi:hypothetical protein